MNMRALHDALGGLSLLAFIGGMAYVLGHCAGCAPGTPATTPASTPACADAGMTQEECAASYATALVACSELATTLAESITCENDVRAHYGRPPRPMPRLKDGGL